MRILVTGVGGFVGPHLARAAGASGDEVFGAGLEASPPESLAGEKALVGWVRWDLAAGAEPGRAALLEARADAVVHLAGQASAARSFEDPAGTFAANAGGTLHLLEALRAARFAGPVLIVSSAEVYGRLEPPSPAREDRPLRPVSPYGASKAAAEALARAYAAGFSLRAVIARSFSHVGPGQSAAFALASWASQIAGFEAAAARGEAGPWRLRVGNLAPVRDYADVRDVVSAYLALLDRGTPGEAYNVASGTGRSLAEVAATLAALARVPVEVLEDPSRLRPADIPYLVGDPSRLVEATGFAPAHSFKRTLHDLLEGARAAATHPAWESS